MLQLIQTARSRRMSASKMTLILAAFTFLAPAPAARAETKAAAEEFRKNVEPILSRYCYDCHGDGMNKGKVALDEFKSDAELVSDHDLWWKVLKNVRAGVMPPEKKPKPTVEEAKILENWIKRGSFGLDPQRPDPGRVTLRRLNRVEYRNTIKDLMGIDYRTDEEFPPDDTGYGFDTIADVLTVSPLLLEKYMQAAETIVASAVPTVAKVIQENVIAGNQFRSEDKKTNGAQMTVYAPALLGHSAKIEKAGDYKLVLNLSMHGGFDFDPGRCTLVFKADGRELLRQDFGWQDGRKYQFEFEQAWQPGEYPLSIELIPLTKAEDKKSSVDMRIQNVKVIGPLAREHWAHPKNYERFFFRDEPPASKPEQREYAKEVLRRFATKAFRRPVDEVMVERLTAFAEESYSEPGKRFEEGVSRAMVAVLASPRFIFRVEKYVEDEKGQFAPVDEYALASRLSYFLWSTMPDEELFSLASRGELRRNLSQQVSRMLADNRSSALMENFPGQWLQARDIDGISIDARSVLARDNGTEKEMRRAIEEFRARIAQQQQEFERNRTNTTAQAEGQRPPNRPRNRPRFPRVDVELDGALRRAMREETEMHFRHIVCEDRPVLELIDSDYTFLNERLAKHYGMTNAGITGAEMRKVSLPADSPRGGILTQGAVLAATSNPTRTSPVKRGLFILENILGSPPPPPPPDVPDLEESEKGFGEREPTLRETLEAHRAQPLCHSCHNRMDPLGLALENFNALGMWRDKERNQSIDAAGKLITGESFSDIRTLKKILTNERRADFYHCLTEKLLTYALGRGLEYYDVETVDQIVARLDKEGGRFSALLMGIIESAPFQQRRNVSGVEAVENDKARQQAAAER